MTVVTITGSVKCNKCSKTVNASGKAIHRELGKAMAKAGWQWKNAGTHLCANHREKKVAKKVKAVAKKSIKKAKATLPVSAGIE